MKNMKKVFAFVLALAMILTTYQPTTTYAATKAPTISAKKMTLQVGSKKTLTVKKAGKNATLKWSSSKKSVATVSKKGVVKAVKAGTANVKCKVVTRSKKHYTLTCKVTVKNAAVSKTVSTQKALAAALKDKNVKNLTIKTDKEVAFNIPSGNYGKVKLTVDAPNADVVNAGTFKSINIKAIKPNTWKEKAKGNTIDAAVDVSLAVDGTVGEVAVSAPAKVAVEGKTTTAIPVKVEETAKGADVTSSTPVEVKAATEISLNLSKGAEGSKVETTGENAQVAVKNDTTDVIKVTTPAGTKEVAKDTTSKVDNTGKVTDTTTNTSGDNNGGSTGGGSTSGGGSSSGGSVTPAPTPDPDPAQTVELNALHVFEKNKIDVEIPTEIIESNKDKIIVTDKNGVTQKIALLDDMDDEEEIADNEDNDDEDDDDDDGTKWYRYMLTFASDLNPGKYTLSYIAGNTEYKGTFWFEADDFEKTAAAAEKVKEEFFEKTFEILPEGKENTWYAYKQLSKKVSEYAGEEYYADVFGGCDEKYIEIDGKTGLNVTIRVQAGEGDVAKDITGMVYFTFTKKKTEVKEPEMHHKTQTSIVVKAEDGQEYICCEEGTEENAINWDDAIAATEQDDFGFIEFSGLKTENKYVIYTRNTEQADEVKKSDEITLSDAKLPIICLAKTDNTNISLKEATLVAEGDSFYIEVPYTVSVQDYGKTPEGYRTSGEATAICTKTDSDPVDVAFVGLPDSGIARVWFEKELSAGNYTIHLEYKYVCEEDKDIENPEKLTASDPITYIVTFTVKDTENK